MVSPTHQTPWTHTDKFTVENPKVDGFVAFLDTFVSLALNNTTTTLKYRKSTHFDQYPHWDSNHNSSAKHSVYNILAHRARVVLTSQQALT